jgi:tryptophan-rich sensory protein
MEKRAPGYGQCFASLGLGLAPLFLLFGVSALFGANTVTFGGQNVHGIGALFVALILNVLFAGIFAGLQKLGYVILGFVHRKRPEVQA